MICKGPCQSSFHADCLGLDAELGSNFKCEDCTTNSHACFLCKKKTVPAAAAPNGTATSSSETNSSVTTATTKRCTANGCGKYYHEECARTSELFRKEQFVCSHHSCTTCLCEAMLNRAGSNSGSKDALLTQASKGKLVKCVRCPSAYHVGDYCIPAGSVVLNSMYIVCPNHFQPLKCKSIFCLQFQLLLFRI